MIFSNLIFLLIIFYLNNHVSAGFDLSCKDERGNSADYWLSYYPPQSSSKGYLYYVKGQSENSWRSSTKNFFGQSSMISKTFSDVYDYFKGGKKSNKLYYLQYNSQAKYIDPWGRHLDAKGIIVWNKSLKKAVWLLHSVPYEDRKGNLFMPSFKKDNKFDYQSKHGHMALCINLNYNDVHSILRNLLAIDVVSYERNIDSDELESIMKIKPFELRKDLRTAANQKFTIHTKLYENVEHMWASKWLTNDDLKSKYLYKTPARLQNCDKRNIADILELEATLNGKKINWNYEQDKSKWSIDVTNDKLCFSDFSRNDFNVELFYGNVLCLNDSKLHGLLDSLIKTRSCRRK